MAQTRWYLNNTQLDGWALVDQTAASAATYASGWVVGTGSTFSSEFQSTGGDRASTTFTANTVPDGTLDTTLKDAFRSQNPINGAFASGNWTFQFAVQGTVQSGAADGQIVFRLIKADANGANATEITSGQQTASVVTNVTTTDLNSSATINPGAFTITNQYLFVQIAWKRTGAGGMTTTNVRLRTGSSSTVGTTGLTADFTNATVLVAHRASTAVVNVPVVVRPAVQAVTVEFVATTLSVPMPVVAIDQPLVGPTILTTATLYEPTVAAAALEQDVTGETVASSALVFVPTMVPGAVGVTTETVAPTASVFAPTLTVGSVTLVGAFIGTVAWERIAHVASTGTSAPIDTRRATYIAIYSATGGSTVPTDSEGNTYTPLVVGFRSVAGYWSVCEAPVTSATHTFTPMTGSVNALIVEAWRGNANTPIDVGEGLFDGTAADNRTSITLPSETPVVNGELLLAAVALAANNAASGYGINSGYTLTDTVNAAPGVTYGIAGGYLVQPTAAAISPTLSWTGSNSVVSRSLTLKPGIGTGTGSTAYAPTVALDASDQAVTTVALASTEQLFLPVVTQASAQAITAAFIGGSTAPTLMSRVACAGHVDASAVSTVAQTHVAGRTLVACVQAQTTGGTITVTDLAGNTYLPDPNNPVNNNGGANYERLFYATNCLGHAANVVTATFVGTGGLSSYKVIVVYELSAPGAIERHVGATGSGNTTTLFTSVLAITQPAFAIAQMEIDGAGSGGTFTPAAGWTVFTSDSGGSAGYIRDMYKSLTAPEAASGTIGGTGDWGAIAAAFAVTGGGGAVIYAPAIVTGQEVTAAFIQRVQSLTTGLTCYWKLDEGQGIRAELVNGQHLTPRDAVASAPGKSGQAADFRRVYKNYLFCDDSPVLRTGHIDWTIAFWAKRIDAGVGVGFIQKSEGSATNADEWEVWSSGSGLIGFDVYGATDGWVGVNTPSAVSAGVWHFIVAWYDAATMNAWLQIDGGAVLMSDDPYYSGPPVATAAPLSIAAYHADWDDQSFTGSVDEVGFWKRLLTAEERTALYNAGLGRTYETLDVAGAEVFAPVVRIDNAIDAAYVNSTELAFAPSLTVTLIPAAVTAVGHWPMDEASGGRADLINGQTLAEANGSMSGVTGKFENAAHFTGASLNRLEATHSTWLQPPSNASFTIRFWMKWTTKPASEQVAHILSKFSSYTDMAFLLQFSGTNNTLQWLVQNASGNSFTGRTQVNALGGVGTWYLVHVWYDHDTLQLGSTVNTVHNTAVTRTTGYVSTNTANLVVGSNPAFAGTAFDGDIDDLVILRYVMSNSERTADYLAGPGIRFENWAGGGIYFPRIASVGLRFAPTVSLITPGAQALDAAFLAATDQMFMPVVDQLPVQAVTPETVASTALAFAPTLTGGGTYLPSQAILDTFNRADENPILTPWTTIPTVTYWGQLRLSANQLMSAANGAFGTSGMAYHTPPMTTDFRAYVTVATLPGNSTITSVGLYADPTQMVLKRGFEAELRRDGSGAFLLALMMHSVLGGYPNEVTLRVQSLTSFAAGDAFGLSRDGTTVRLWTRIGGVWDQVWSDVNAAHIGGMWPLVEIPDTTTRLDDFSAGPLGPTTIIGAHIPSGMTLFVPVVSGGGTWMPDHPVLDDFNRANADPLGGNWGQATDTTNYPSLQGIDNAISGKYRALYVAYAGSSYYLTPLVPDFRVWLTMPVGLSAPSSGSTASCVLGVYTTPQDNPTRRNGFELELIRNTPNSTYQIWLAQRIDGNFSQIGQNQAPFFGPGDAYGISRDGNWVRAWLRIGGAWTNVRSVETPNHAGPLWVGVWWFDKLGTGRLDNLSGGPLTQVIGAFIGVPAWTRIAHTAAAGTTTAIDTQGATVIAVFVSGGGSTPLIDSEGNTWTPTAVQTGGTASAIWWYCAHPITSATHTFTTDGTDSLIVEAWRGNSAAPGDQSGGGTRIGNNWVNPAPVVPTERGELALVGAGTGGANTSAYTSTSPGFVLADTVNGNASGGISGAAAAYQIQTGYATVVAAVIGWTVGGAADGVARSLTLKAEPGAGGLAVLFAPTVLHPGEAVTTEVITTTSQAYAPSVSTTQTITGAFIGVGLAGVVDSAVLIASGKNGHVTLAQVTGLNMTGATVLVMVVAFAPGTALTAADSESNVYERLPDSGDGINQPTCAVFLCDAPVVSASMNFSATGTVPGLIVFGFSGSLTGAYYGNVASPAWINSNKLALVGLSPEDHGEVAIAAMSFSAGSSNDQHAHGFTTIETLPLVASVNYGCWAAYRQQAVRALSTPLISWTGNAPAAGQHLFLKFAHRGSARVTVTDDFERTDNSSSLGTTPTGHVWTAHEGTWGIETGAAKVFSGASQNVATVETGVSNGVVTALLQQNPIDAGLIGRFIDNNNYWLWSLRGTGWELYLREAGTFTSVALFGTAFYAGDTASLEFLGPSIIGKRNGVTVMTYVNPKFQSGTRFGIRDYSAVWRLFENFSFTELDLPPVTGTDALKTDLVGYWSLDEPIDVYPAFDLHNTGQYLSPVGNPLVGNGWNGSRGMGNTGQYLVGTGLGAAHSVGGTDAPFTWSTWVYLTNKDSYRPIIQKFTADPPGFAEQTEYSLIYFNGDDRFQCAVANGTTYGGVTATSFGSPAVGTWYHIIFWHDPDANTLNIQVNGGAVDSTSWSGGTQISTQRLYFGRQTNGDFTLGGYLDEAAFWHRLLTSDERAALYNGGKALPYDRFEEPPPSADMGGGGGSTVYEPTIDQTGTQFVTTTPIASTEALNSPTVAAGAVAITTAFIGGSFVNVGASASGGVASASTSDPSYDVDNINDGNMASPNWGGFPNGGWNGTSGSPQWVQIDFDATYTIEQVDLVTLQNDYTSATPPVLVTTLSDVYGVYDYVAQYWNGSGWTAFTGGTFINQPYAYQQLTGLSVATDKIRVYMTVSSDDVFRWVELQAWASVGSGGTALFAPTVEGEAVSDQAVTTLVIASTLQVTAPSVAPGAVSVVGATTVTTVALFAPALTAVALGATIPPTSGAFAPTVALTLQGASIPATSLARVPSVQPGAVTVLGVTVAATSLVRLPTITVGAVTITLPTLAATSQVFLPTLAAGPVAVTLAHRATTITITLPTITVGAVTILGVTRATTTAMNAPTITVGAVAVTLAHRATTAVVQAPALASVALGATIPASSAAFAPSLTPVVALPTLASTAVMNVPAIDAAGAQAVTTEAIAPTAVLSEPIVGLAGVTNIGTATLLAASLLFAVTLTPGAVGVTAATVPTTSARFAPTLTMNVALATRASTTVLTAPALAGTLTTAHRATTLAVFAPTLAGAVTTPAWAATSVLFAPTVLPIGALGGPTAAPTTQVYALTVSAGAVTVGGATIPVTSDVTRPTVGLGITAGTVGSTTVMNAPSLTVGATTVTLARIGPDATAFAPLVGVGATAISAATVVGTAVVYAPEMIARLDGIFITSTAQLFPLTVRAHQAVTGATIPAGSQSFALTILPVTPITGATVASALVVYAPQIPAQVQSPFLGSTALLFGPTVEPVVGDIVVGGLLPTADVHPPSVIRVGDFLPEEIHDFGVAIVRWADTAVGLVTTVSTTVAIVPDVTTYEAVVALVREASVTAALVRTADISVGLIERRGVPVER